MEFRGETIGRLFEFHPSMVKGRGSVLDVNLDALMRLRAPDTRYVPIRRFPSSAFDLSVIVKERALVGDIQAAACVACRSDARTHRLCTTVLGRAARRRHEERFLSIDARRCRPDFVFG